MTTLQTALTVATAATASGTLAAGKHTPVDATSGALTMTLPTPSTVGARLRVEKVDASANVVTVSGTIRGGASTISLAWQYESVELFAESLTSWRVAAGHKTKASLDAAYAGQVTDAAVAGQVTSGASTTAALRAAFDARTASLSAVTRDTAGRISGYTQDGVTVTLTRDTAGRVSTVTTGSTTQTIARDSAGRVSGVA